MRENLESSNWFIFKGFWLIICFIIIAILVALGVMLFCVWKRKKAKTTLPTSAPTIAYQANPPYQVFN